MAAEQVNMGWLKDYDGVRFLPKTLTIQILNVEGELAFPNTAIGADNNPIYWDGKNLIAVDGLGNGSFKLGVDGTITGGFILQSGVTNSYGSTLPSSGTLGQLFFKI